MTDKQKLRHISAAYLAWVNGNTDRKTDGKFHDEVGNWLAAVACDCDECAADATEKTSNDHHAN